MIGRPDGRRRLRGNQSDDQIRPRRMVQVRGNHYRRPPLHTHHTGKVRHHHVSRAKQALPLPGTVLPHTEASAPSARADLPRSTRRQTPRIPSPQSTAAESEKQASTAPFAAVPSHSPHKPAQRSSTNSRRLLLTCHFTLESESVLEPTYVLRFTFYVTF